MSNESYLTRRKLLAGAGVATASSLSGCSVIENLRGFNSPPESPDKSANGITIRKVPETIEGVTDRTALVSPDVVDRLSLLSRQQVRVTRPGLNFSGHFLSAVYTVRTQGDFLNQTDKTNTLWLSESGQERINTSEGWIVQLSRFAPGEDVETTQGAIQNNELGEQYINGDETDFLFLAPHGGNIYPNTEKQAVRTATQLNNNAWLTMGYNEGGGAYDRWYIPEDEIHPISYPKLDFMVEYNFSRQEYDKLYESVVSFTQFEGDGIVIGGLAKDETKEDIRDQLRDTFSTLGTNPPVRIAYDGQFSGTDPNYLANRVSQNRYNGIRLLQSENITQNNWRDVSNSLIQYYSTYDE